MLFYFTVVVQEKMRAPGPQTPTWWSTSTAFQWNWKFGYQQINFKDGTLNYDGLDPARKNAMLSKPEGIDAHGEERVGAIEAATPRTAPT